MMTEELEPHLGDPQRDAADLTAMQNAYRRCRDENWNPMSEFAKDGTRCAILFKYGAVNDQPLWWRRTPLGDKMTIIGEQNAVSPYLVPLGWKKFEDKDKPTEAQLNLNL